MPSKTVPAKNLCQWLSYLEALHTSEIDLGLDRVLTVYRKMPISQIAGCVIVVGGTNGKGTTIAVMEALLHASGKTVGCYTSPHIHHFNERIRLAGRDVSDKTLIDAFEVVEKHRGQVSLTYFEFSTLAALYILSRQMPDYALLEVGLGGRLDAVNIVDSDLSIITSVDIDHQDWLGDSRESIGFEKAGIMRLGGICVYGEVNPTKSIVQQAAAQNVDLRIFGRDFGVLDPEKTHENLAFLAQNSAQQPAVPGKLTPVAYQNAKGEYQRADWSLHSIPISNRLCAIQALALSGLNLSEIDSHRCIGQVAVPGRFEIDRDNPRFIFDVAHNVPAAAYLSQLLQTIKKQRQGKILCLFSALQGKDSKGIVSLLDTTVDFWVTWPLAADRALSREQLISALAGVASSAESVSTVERAVVRAESIAWNSSDTVLVLGSFHAVAEVKAFLANRR